MLKMNYLISFGSLVLGVAIGGAWGMQHRRALPAPADATSEGLQRPVLLPEGNDATPASHDPARPPDQEPGESKQVAVYPLETWIEVPAAIIHRAEIADLTSYLYQPFTGAGSRSWLSPTLKLTPLEAESIHQILVEHTAAWGNVALNYLVKIEEGRWVIQIPPEERMSLRKEFIREITAALGAERAYVFQATTYQGLEKLYGEVPLKMRCDVSTGEWTVGYPDGSGIGFMERHLDKGAPILLLMGKAK